jgi:hypothetical protein
MLPFFRDLLSNKPVQGADAIHGLAGWSEGSTGRVGKGKNGQILLSGTRRLKKLYFSSLGLKTGL